MARFELATSSLPRRHTAGLCHIGTFFRLIVADNKSLSNAVAY